MIRYAIKQPLDLKILNECIERKTPFRIGARGICCDCTPDDFGWDIEIPRAHMKIHGTDLAVNTVTRKLYYSLAGVTFFPILDLKEYCSISYGAVVKGGIRI